MNKISPKIYLTTKLLFITSLVVVLLVVLAVWFWGLGQHKTLFENSLWSTSILSLFFFLFLSINLYRDVKLKDNLGKITDNINRDSLPSFDGFDISGMDIPDAGEGVLGFLLGLLLWLLVSIILVTLIVLLGTIVWIIILLFAAMLYWIFFRALRFAFRHGRQTKNNLKLSIGYALLYTVFYNCWIYGIILAVHYWT
jgi:small-conductance mechanosensitive channel